MLHTRIFLRFVHTAALAASAATARNNKFLPGPERWPDADDAGRLHVHAIDLGTEPVTAGYMIIDAV